MTDRVRLEACAPDGISLEKINPGYEPKVPLLLKPGQEAGQVEICQPDLWPLSREDLLLPDLITLPPTDLNIKVNPSNGQKFLRFTNSIVNNGPGKIELWGGANPKTGKVTVNQAIYTTEGSSERVVVGEFFFHLEHNHWHLGNFSHYEILSLGRDGTLDQVVALGNKISYCLRDDADSEIPGAAIRQTYTNCNQERQGISVGWIDIYRYHLPGQSIDITSLSDGVYALRSTVNPENNLWEQNSENNAFILYFEIMDKRVDIIELPALPDQSLKDQDDWCTQGSCD